MNSFLLFFGGAVATLAARELAKKLRIFGPQITSAVDKKIPGLIDAVEERTGIDVPDAFEAAFNQTLHNIVYRSVAFAETYVYDAKFWEKVLKALLSSRTEKAGALVASLVAWLKSVDWKSQFMLSLPEELRPIVNQVKENEAVLTASTATNVVVDSAKIAGVVSASRSLAPSAEEIRPLVQQAATSLKIQPGLTEQYNRTGMTKELVTEILKRHEERMKQYQK